MDEVRDVPGSREKMIPIEYGSPKKYDPDFRGPIKNRSCTDVICLLLFIAFLCGWGFVGFLGYSYGDPESLLLPTDSLGRKCGKDTGVKDKPYLFFFDLTQCANALVLVNGCPTTQVCVRQCPQVNLFVKTLQTTGTPCDESVRKKFICKQDVNALEKNSDGDFTRSCKNLVEQDCAFYYITSSPVLGRCIPTFQNNQSTSLGNFNIDKSVLLDGIEKLGLFVSVQTFGESVWKDLQSSWWLIVIALVTCMLVSLIWIVLMRWFAGVLVWVSLFGSLAALAFGCGYTYVQYDALKKAENGQSSAALQKFSNSFGGILQSKNTWLTFFIILCVVLGILLLLVLVLCKRLRIAVEVIAEASKAVSSTLFSLIYPIFPWILQLAALLSFAAVAAHVASMSTQVYRVTDVPANCTSQCPNITVNSTCTPGEFAKKCPCHGAVCEFQANAKYEMAPYLQLYNLFAVLWSVFFVSALGQMVLAGAFASWYFTFDKSKNLPMFPLTGSTYRTLRYHLGTLAFGSLIIAIVRLIRMILDYIDKKCRQYPGNEIARAVLCVCKCCMWCLETFMKFINRNAYIMCSIYGKNFCTSAKDAFSLLMRNVLRVLAVNSVCDFLLFLGKVLITVGVTLGSFYFLDKRIDGLNHFVPETNNSWALLLIIAVGCYLITSLFFSVYSMAVDTIFLCFLEDLERNDGSKEKPYFMSKNLMRLLGKRNTAKNTDSSMSAGR